MVDVVALADLKIVWTILPAPRSGSASAAVTRESKQTFLSPFQRAAEVVDLLHGIPAARQCGGGGGVENSAGLRLSRSRGKEEERGGG